MAPKSSMVPKRPAGMLAIRSAFACSTEMLRLRAVASKFAARRSVSIAPGSRLLMVTLNFTVLRESPAMKPVRPERAPLERPRMSSGAFTALEVMFTTRPKRRWIMPSTVRRMSSMGVSMLASSALIQMSRSHSRKSPGGGPPALLTRMSGLGQASSASRLPSSVVMSAASAVTLTPVLRRISSAVASRAGLPRARITRLAPSAASAMAQPLPSPLLAAQTKAVLPLMPKSMAHPLAQSARHHSAGMLEVQPLRPRHRLQRFEIDRDRMSILVGELARALDHLRHAGAHGVEIRQLPGLEHGLDVLEAPLADALLRVRRYVRGALVVRTLRISGVSQAHLHRAQEVPGRVAFAAMGDRVGEIAAAVPGVFTGRIGLPRPFAEEQRAPEQQPEAEPERWRDLVRLVPLLNGGLGAKEGPEVRDVGISESREGREGKHREHVATVVVDALAQRAAKLRLRPVADPGFRVRRDVGAVEGPEWRRERPAARERLSIVPDVGVAARAVRGCEEIGAALHRLVVSRPRRWSGQRDCREYEGGKQTRSSCARRPHGLNPLSRGRCRGRCCSCSCRCWRSPPAPRVCRPSGRPPAVSALPPSGPCRAP